MKAMFRRLCDRAFTIFCYYDSEPVELFLGAIGLVFGLSLLNPFTDAFSVDVYSGMAALASETVWGLALTALAIWRGLAVLLDSRLHRQTVGFVGFLVWLFTALTFFDNQPSAPAGPLVMVYAVHSLWIYMRHGVRKGA